MKTKTVEVFTANCPICEPLVQLVKQIACDTCEVLLYDLNAGRESNTCRDKAKAYGVKQLPSVAVNGELLACRQGTGITEAALRAAGVGLQPEGS